MPERFHQTPGYEVKLGSEDETKPIYFINNPRPAADAVITEVNGKQAKLWLGGVDLTTIDNSTVFSVVNGKGKVTLQSRNGFSWNSDSGRGC